MKIAVIGGDVRQCYAALELEKRGIETAVWGIDTPLKTCAATVGAALDGAAAALLPMPASRDGIMLNAPLWPQKVELRALTDALKGVPLVLAGKADEQFVSGCHEHGMELYDYADREEITVSGAISTAEAAVGELIKCTGRSVYSSRILIIGGGRIGCRLARILEAMGAEVTISARKKADVSRLASMGYSAIYTNETENCCGGFDAVINTVPAEVISLAAAQKLKEDCCVLDLASAPGGVSPETARMLGVRYVPALGLPGKHEPKTAGLALCEAVVNILKEGDML